MKTLAVIALLWAANGVASFLRLTSDERRRGWTIKPGEFPVILVVLVIFVLAGPFGWAAVAERRRVSN